MSDERRFTEKVDATILDQLPPAVRESLKTSELNTYYLFEFIKEGIAAGEAKELDGLPHTRANQRCYLEISTDLDHISRTFEQMKSMTTHQHNILLEKLLKVAGRFMTKKIKDEETDS